MSNDLVHRLPVLVAVNKSELEDAAPAAEVNFTVLANFL